MDKSYSRNFLLITGAFITCLITSNLASIKLLSFFGTIFDAGTILFPITYIFGDVLTEVYGFKKTRIIIWLGFACNFFMVLVMYLMVRLPPCIDWQGQKAFETIFDFAPRIVIASFCAYLAGEFANSIVMSTMKKITRGRHLWTRTIGSTLVGEFIDSLIFGLIAFSSILTPWHMAVYILSQWSFKSGYEILATPVTYKIINCLKRKEGIDTFDYGVSYNPFGF